MGHLTQCRLIDLPVFRDDRGALSFVEGGNHIPFDIQRIYYLYDVTSGATRGAHAHKCLQQLILPIAGSFEVTLDDGEQSASFHLGSPDRGLYVRSGIWRDLKNFSAGATCLVLASETFNESDYIRDYQAFKRWVSQQ